MFIFFISVSFDGFFNKNVFLYFFLHELFIDKIVFNTITKKCKKLKAGDYRFYAQTNQCVKAEKTVIALNQGDERKPAVCSWTKGSSVIMIKKFQVIVVKCKNCQKLIYIGTTRIKINKIMEKILMHSANMPLNGFD